MLRVFVFLMLIIALLQAEETLQVEDFEVSVFSRLSEKPVMLEASMIFEGRDVVSYDYKVIDALNVVIGSFFAENLLTSKGKESLKQAIINYTKDKYALGIEFIYIQKLNIKKELSAHKIIEEMKKGGCCRKE